MKEELDQMLESIVQLDTELSDVLFITGRAVQIESQGHLMQYLPTDTPEMLTSDRIKALAGVIIGNNPQLLSDLKEHGSCDTGYSLKDGCRFRVNIYFENGNQAMVMRHLKPAVPSIESLGLGPTFLDVIREKNGIVFVTGGTGVGKTTTIAAMLNEINRTRDVHILTLEDPVEFMHTPIKATFSQRELGRDFFDFKKGMRAAMRQAPKVIFVGEIRDRETMEIVLSAGETGHLVLSTLHTSSASATVNRVIGMFNPDEEAQIRERLAGAMRYVIGQRLVPAVTGGRLLVTEIMGSSLRTREAIALGESENRRLDEIIEAGVVSGWHSFEQSLGKAYEKGLITRETALAHCTSRGKMTQRLDNVVYQKNHATTTSLPPILELKMGASAVSK